MPATAPTHTRVLLIDDEEVELAEENIVREFRVQRAWERAMASAQEAMREPFEVKVDFMLGCGLYEAPGGGGYWTSDGWATDAAGIARTYGPHASLEAPPLDGTRRGWIVQHNEYIYVLRGRYAAKYIPNDTRGVEWPIVSLHDFRDDNSTEEADEEPVVCGRPAIFDGKLYVPLMDEATDSLARWAVLTEQDAPSATTTWELGTTATSDSTNGGTRAWDTPANALTEDTTYTVASGAGLSHELRVSGFSFGLDSDAEVRGIEVEVLRKGSGTQAQFISVSSNTAGPQTASAYTVVVTTPASVQEGDTLIAMTGHYEDARTLTAPAGWEMLRSRSVDNTAQGVEDEEITLRAYRREVAADEPATHTFTVSADTGGDEDTSCGVVIAAYRGVDFDSIEAPAFNSGINAAPVDVPTGAIAVHLQLLGKSLDIGPDTDYTERSEESVSGAQLNYHIFLADRTFTAPAVEHRARAEDTFFGSDDVAICGIIVLPPGASLVDNTVAIISEGTTSESKAVTTPWPSTAAARAYGGATDTWGLTGITGTTADSLIFALSTTSANDFADAEVDQIRVRLTYYVENSDTWARGPDNTVSARCFVVWRNKLVRAAADEVSMVSGDPLLPENWGPEYRVGASGHPVTDLVVYYEFLMAAKPDGLYSFDEDTIAGNELPDLEAVVYDDNYIGMEVAQGAIFAPHAVGLVRWRPGAYKIIGEEQDGLSEGLPDADVTHGGGYTRSLARYGKQIYYVKGPTQGQYGVAGHFGLMVPGQARASGFIPHMLETHPEGRFFETVQVVTSSSGTAYAVTLLNYKTEPSGGLSASGVLCSAYLLPRNGQSNARDRGVSREPEGTARLVTPFYRDRDSTVRNVWQHVVVDAPVVESELTVKAAVDEESAEEELGTMTAAGVERIRFPDGGQGGGPTRLIFEATGEAALRDVRLRGHHVTYSDEAFSAVVVVRDGPNVDGRLQAGAGSQADRLARLRTKLAAPDFTTEPLTMRDPDTGESLRVVVKDYSERDVDAPRGGSPSKAIRISGLVLGVDS